MQDQVKHFELSLLCHDSVSGWTRCGVHMFIKIKSFKPLYAGFINNWKMLIVILQSNITVIRQIKSKSCQKEIDINLWWIKENISIIKILNGVTTSCSLWTLEAVFNAIIKNTTNFKKQTKKFWIFLAAFYSKALKIDLP